MKKMTEVTAALAVQQEAWLWLWLALAYQRSIWH